MKGLLAALNLIIAIIIIIILSRFYGIEWWITALTIILYNAVLLAWKEQDNKDK